MSTQAGRRRDTWRWEESRGSAVCWGRGERGGDLVLDAVDAVDEGQQRLLRLVSAGDQRRRHVAERGGAAVGDHPELALHQLA